MIKISLSRLEKEPIVLTGEEPPEFLEVEPTEQFYVSAPIRYELNAAMVTGGALVEGFASTAVSGICGRCLYPVEDEKVRTADLTLFFDEIDGIEELDISEDIRSEVLLTLPMNLLCDENCAGLCPVCGADLNEEECDCVIEPPEEKDSEENPWGALDQLNLK